MQLNRNFHLRLSLSESPSPNLQKLSDALSEITLLFDLSLDLDQTLPQRKTKSNVKWPRLSSGEL